MSIALDTLDLLEKLTKNNHFTNDQAKNIIDAVRDVEERGRNVFATKQDLEKYYYKTVITLGAIMTGIGGIITSIIIAVLHK